MTMISFLFSFLLIGFQYSVLGSSEQLRSIILSQIENSGSVDYIDTRFPSNHDYELRSFMMMEDILNRHREVSHVVFDEFKAMDQGKFESACMKKAIRPIMGLPRVEGTDALSPTLQRETATKLSICEFEAAMILYPNECKDLSGQQNGVQNCIIALESKPQWWTTYTVNYKAVKDIWSQESLAFEKEQILAVYTNITGIYQNILINLESTIFDTDILTSQSKEKFEELKSIITEFITTSRISQSTQKQEYASAIQEMQDTLKITHELTAELSNESEYMNSNLMDFFGDITSTLESMRNELNDEDYTKKIKQMKESFLQDQSALTSEMITMMDNIREMLENNELHASKVLEGSQVAVDELFKFLIATEDNMKSSAIGIKSELNNMAYEISENFEVFINKMDSELNGTMGKLSNLKAHIEGVIDIFECVSATIETTVRSITDNFLFKAIGIFWQASKILHGWFGLAFFTLASIVCSTYKLINSKGLLLKLWICMALCLALTSGIFVSILVTRIVAIF